MVDRRRGADPSDPDRGFTLVELLVVVLIIAILAGIAIAVFLAQRQRAQEAAVEADLRNMAGALMTFGTRDAGMMTSAVAAGSNVAGTQLSVGGQPIRPPLVADVEFRGSNAVDLFLAAPLDDTLCLVGHVQGQAGPWYTYTSRAGGGLILSRHEDRASADAAC